MCNQIYSLKTMKWEGSKSFSVFQIKILSKTTYFIFLKISHLCTKNQRHENQSVCAYTKQLDQRAALKSSTLDHFADSKHNDETSCKQAACRIHDNFSLCLHQKEFFLTVHHRNVNHIGKIKF